MSEFNISSVYFASLRQSLMIRWHVSYKYSQYMNLSYSNIQHSKDIDDDSAKESTN